MKPLPPRRAKFVRVVDGYDAGAFIQRVKGMLEHPAALFIDQ